MFHNSWLFFGLLEFLCCTHSTLGTLGDFSFNKFYLLLRKGSGLLIQGFFFFFFGFNFYGLPDVVMRQCLYGYTLLFAEIWLCLLFINSVDFCMIYELCLFILDAMIGYLV